MRKSSRKDNIPSNVVLISLIIFYDLNNLRIIFYLSDFTLVNVSIKAGAGLPAAKVLCGDVGVAGEGGGGAVVGCLRWV